MGEKREKTDDYSGYYVIASSRPPERRTLVPKLMSLEGSEWLMDFIYIINSDAYRKVNNTLHTKNAL